MMLAAWCLVESALSRQDDMAEMRAHEIDPEYMTKGIESST